MLNLFHVTNSLYPHESPIFVSPEHGIWQFLFGDSGSDSVNDGNCEIFNTEQELEALAKRPTPTPTPTPEPTIPEHKKDNDEGDCQIFFIPKK
jgi:hypothetical protein